MKTLKVKIAMVLVLMLAGTFNKNAEAQPSVSISFQAFYDDLSPYGSWVSYPSHGYVWIPAAGPGFRPYATNGHWVMTDMGWMWASNYDWGWAPFHYGSWMFDPFYGWMWVPGYQWAPAWVVWGQYDNYYGWAPVAPGFSISIGYRPPIDYWSFMHPRFMTAPDLGGHFFVSRNRRIEMGSNTVINNVNNITVVNNTGRSEGASFNAGPRRDVIEKAGNVSVRPVAIRESSRPVASRPDKNGISIYRPRVSKATTVEKPRAVTPLEKVKREPASGKDLNGRSISRPDGTSKTRETNPEIRKEKQREQTPAIRNDRKETPAMRPAAPQRQPQDVKPERAPQNEKRQHEPIRQTERKQESIRPSPSQRETPQLNRPERGPETQPSREAAPRSEPRREIRQLERTPEQRQLDQGPSQRMPEQQQTQPRQEERRGRKK